MAVTGVITLLVLLFRLSRTSVFLRTVQVGMFLVPLSIAVNVFAFERYWDLEGLEFPSVLLMWLLGLAATYLLLHLLARQMDRLMGRSDGYRHGNDDAAPAVERVP